MTTAPVPRGQGQAASHTSHPHAHTAREHSAHATARRRFPGRANQVRYARRFVERCLGDCPETGTAALLTSEVTTNAITHSATGEAGGKFDITVHTGHGWARVEVRDLGSPRMPQALCRDPYDASEHGRGLDLVEALAGDWGSRPRESGIGRLVWFELTWEV